MNLENLRNLNSNINHKHQCIYELKTLGQKTQDRDSEMVLNCSGKLLKPNLKKGLSTIESS